jgi:hypothetical protein
MCGACNVTVLWLRTFQQTLIPSFVARDLARQLLLPLQQRRFSSSSTSALLRLQ